MVTVNTLDSLIDDILLIIRNSNIVESENINRLQIKQWVDTYRALLIKQDIDKDGDVNPEYIQYIEVDLIVEKLNNTSSICKMKSVKKLPRTLDLNNKYGIISITDRNGNVIQMGDENKAVKQKHRRFTCNDYIAFIKNNHLNMMGPLLIENVIVGGVFQNPDEVIDFNEDCKDDDQPYNIPYDKIPALKQLILKTELGIMIQMPTDIINNAKNENLSNVKEK